MVKKDLKKLSLFLPVFFIGSICFVPPLFASNVAEKADPMEPLEHEENEINVQGEHVDKNCPISIHQGKILGASHGTHTKYLPSVNIPYRERFTFFSVADGEKTYLVRRQGVLHVRDYVGVIVTAPCRQTVAEVAAIGPLLIGTDQAAENRTDEAAEK